MPSGVQRRDDEVRFDDLRPAHDSFMGGMVPFGRDGHLNAVQAKPVGDCLKAA